jgi:branched-chain amino acid transport system ATP-binding protein
VSDTPLLRLESLQAGHGAARVLHGLDLELPRGQTLVVAGRNGAGKTTLVETLIGHTTLHGGRILLDGRPIERLAPHRRNRLGVAWVPQEREVFPTLTVEEHLDIVQRGPAWPKARIWELFPRLRERRHHHGDQLSGGEQQMLAVGRALATGPRLLLLDEPLEGLAPRVVQEMMAAIDAMRAEARMAILLVEQKHELALQHSDRCVVLDHGVVVHASPSADLLADPALVARLLGVSE